MYRGTPPWAIDRPQRVFQRLADTGEITGRCGTGEHVLVAAALGLDAVGVDLAPTAITAAERKALDRGLTARFEVLDVVNVPTLHETFDTVLDCGLLHALPDDAIAPFVRAVAAVLRPGGRYHLLCMSDAQPGHAGPRRTSQAFIREAFADGWEVRAITPAALEVTIGSGTMRAWYAAITRC